MLQPASMVYITLCTVLLNSWSRWILSYEKGLKEHPEIPYHVVYYEQLKEVSGVFNLVVKILVKLFTQLVLEVFPLKEQVHSLSVCLSLCPFLLLPSLV